MGVTRFKSNLYVPGTIACGYTSDVAGTAYGVNTGLGSAYKFTAGTGQLVGGSLGISPALSVLYGVVAQRIIGTAVLAAYGTSIGTAAPLYVKMVKTGAGGTAAILSAPYATTNDGAVSGTAVVSWLAFGY